MELIAEQDILLSNLKEIYYMKANECEKQWVRDNAAALKIQSKFRMYIKRKEFLRKKTAAIKISTHFRAYYARKLYKQKRQANINQQNLGYFTQQAIIIQKVFRGYYIRKVMHNFYMRKQELKELAQRNNQFRQQLDQFGKAQALEGQQYQQKLAKAQFQALAKNLHHLSSTKNIPGVYNSPFALQKPAVFQKTVQQHLKTAFRQNYKWQAPNRETILKYSVKATNK